MYRNVVGGRAVDRHVGVLTLETRDVSAEGAAPSFHFLRLFQSRTRMRYGLVKDLNCRWDACDGKNVHFIPATLDSEVVTAVRDWV